MSRRWVRRVVWFGIIPLVVILGTVWLLGWLALRQVTPANLTLQIESVFNCRARVDACAVRLFPGPARLQLSGVQLSPRDAAADNAVPPGAREPTVVRATYLRVRDARLDLELLPLLLRREVSVKQFVITGADVKFDLLPGGENTLRALFEKPAIVKGGRNPALIAAAPIAVALAAAAPPAAEGKPEAQAGFGDEPARVFNARELPVSSRLDRVTLEDARIRLRNRKSRSVIELNGCTLEISDLAVDPSDLSSANRATVALRTRLTPFDAATGNLNPDLVFDVLLKQGSMVQKLPVMQKLQKNIDRAQQAGLKLKDLTAEARMRHDTTLKLRLHANRLHLVEAAALDFPDYSLRLDPASHLDAGTETHEFRAELVASQAVSDEALAGANDFLDQLGDEAAGELRKLFITPMVRDGRIAVAFVSTGDLDNPKVKADLPFQGIKDQIEDMGRQLRDAFREPKEK